MVFFMVLDSNPNLKKMYIILEVTNILKVEVNDLHFDNFDLRSNIVKWGVIFAVLNGSGLKSELKKDVYYTGGHQCLKSGGQ